MSDVRDVKLLDLPQLGDDRGRLVVAESNKNIPFIMKRVFYIYGSEHDVVRGQHANRKSEFVLINVAGTSKVRCLDTQGVEVVYTLDRPYIGVYLPTMIWKDMYEFSPDSVLLVLSNEPYDPGEYVRDFEEFKRLGKEGRI